jgi:hypothetical protein
MNDTMSDYRRWRLERRDREPNDHPERPLTRSFGPEDLQRGQRATFDTEDGQILRGQVVDWGPRGAKVHVLDTTRGDHFRRVPYATLRSVRVGADIATAAPTVPDLPPDLLEPGDLISVRTPIGTLLDCVVVTSPTVEVALDDGRRMMVRFGQLAELRPGAGLERLRGLKQRWADSPGAALESGPTDAELGLDPMPDRDGGPA